jgi:cation diffusion facilitator family transporter
LLLLGKKKATRPPDRGHAFGHGKELYFWTLIVAILIFALGGGMSIYEGIVHIKHPHLLENPFWNYIVLGVAFVSETVSFSVAYRRIRNSANNSRLWTFIRQSKDPTTFTVLFEDSAALLGILIATAGVYFGHRFENPFLDGGASILIGLLLCAIATLLARESKGLLLGESATPAELKAIREILTNHPAVQDVAEILTMYLGAESLLVTIDILFVSHLSS